MTDKTEDKVETLPDLDDLLQCPVCYEIPSGQIFQCNEGHHVCGRCKMRLDVCPVCRAFFFGTRNYAMEELISNVRKLRAFKLGGKVTTGSPPEEDAPETRESSSEDTEVTTVNNNDDDVSSRTSVRAPSACKGLFRCLCCKKNPERLPLARLLNHIRYFHSPDLIESRSENGGYLQAWQFPTTPGRMVTAVRIHDMGIFFLVIEITHESVHAWMSMAAAPWVAHEFSYSFTLSGNDREAIFSDCVWSVRSCEGSLKRQGRCLAVVGADARALLSPAAMSGKLSVRRTPHELQPHVTQPRAVLRVANRSTARDVPEPADVAHDLEPFLQDLQNDVARLSRAFATLGREANALVRSEAEMRARLESGRQSADDAPEPRAENPPAPPPPDAAERHLSRSARRRMRQRLRQAFRESRPDSPDAAPPLGAARYDENRVQATATGPPIRAVVDHARASRTHTAPDAARPGSHQNNRPQNNQIANNAARVSNNGQTSAINPSIAVRAGSGQNSSVPARATNGPPSAGRFNANELSDGDIQSLAATLGTWPFMASGPSAPPPVPPPSGGPSNERPANGNTMTDSEIQSLAATIRVMMTMEPAAPPAAPPPVPPPFGGPSNDRPANGNARNKKKRRQRRLNM